MTLLFVFFILLCFYFLFDFNVYTYFIMFCSKFLSQLLILYLA